MCVWIDSFFFACMPVPVHHSSPLTYYEDNLLVCLPTGVGSKGLEWDAHLFLHLLVLMRPVLVELLEELELEGLGDCVILGSHSAQAVRHQPVRKYFFKLIPTLKNAMNIFTFYSPHSDYGKIMQKFIIFYLS